MTLNFNIALSELNTKEYKFMVANDGKWQVSDVIIAECDAEAIHDADEIFKEFNMEDWQYSIKLMQENRVVKMYNNKPVKKSFWDFVVYA